jgi:hypothetical protein
VHFINTIKFITKKLYLYKIWRSLKMAINNSRNMYERLPIHGQVQFDGSKLIYIVFIALLTIATTSDSVPEMWH